ncbi:MAG: hypothetical protein MEQ74_05145 [Paracoccus sp.]|nr:hypothetical protein [Paracoccus sp. (in: a-proteobacteria)]
MSDRAEDLITALEAVCAVMGVPVERDRVLPVQQNQAPLVVVRTGEEFMDPPDNATMLHLGLRWTIDVSVEHYVATTSPAATRASLDAAWAAFRTAFFASPIVRGDMLANGTIPGLGRVPTSPSTSPNIGGQVFSLSFTFNRKL